jgi:type I restriction enzyme R subunit
VKTLSEFVGSQRLTCAPLEVTNINDDAARTTSVNQFKQVQRLKTQLDQYTDLQSGAPHSGTGRAPQGCVCLRERNVP